MKKKSFGNERAMYDNLCIYKLFCEKYLNSPNAFGLITNDKALRSVIKKILQI